AVTAGVVTALGRRLVSVPAGFAAGLVFAALPNVTFYGQDAREYAMVAMLATIASYLLVRAMPALPRRRRWLAAYGVTLAGLGLGNLLALLLIPAHALTLAFAVRGDPPGPSRRRLVHGWLAAAAAALVVVSPVALIGWRQRAQIAWIKPLNVRLVTGLEQLLSPPAMVSVVLVIVAAAAAVTIMRGRPRPPGAGRRPPPPAARPIPALAAAPARRAAPRVAGPPRLLPPLHRLLHPCRRAAHWHRGSRARHGGGPRRRRQGNPAGPSRMGGRNRRTGAHRAGRAARTGGPAHPWLARPRPAPPPRRPVPYRPPPPRPVPPPPPPARAP